jgi:hypothetical protein
MANIDWDTFTSDAHRTAQNSCLCLIACAVDGTTRKAVCEQLDYARRVGDVGAIPLLIAQLTGPCCLPPTTKEAPACPDPADNPLT